jgi:hypothetical protein
MKTTKAAIKEFIKNKLGTDRNWACAALVKIYALQTDGEKSWGRTQEDNGIGFSGCDGEFMSSLAVQYMRRNSLSDKQMAFVLRKMPKYWQQVFQIGDKKKIFAAMGPEHLENYLMGVAEEKLSKLDAS